MNNEDNNSNMKQKIITFLKKNNVKFRFNNGYVKTNRTNIRIPELSNEISYLLGVIYGDGCLQKPIKNQKGSFRFRITITIQSKEYFDFLSKLAFKLFNYKPTFYFHRNHYDFYLTSAAIFAYFRSLGTPTGKKYGKLKIPNKIKSDEILFFNFLAGLIDTDGSFNGSSFYLSQKDIGILNEIIRIGNTFNLKTSELKSSPFKLKDGSLYDRRYILVRKDKRLLSALKHPRFINIKSTTK